MKRFLFVFILQFYFLNSFAIDYFSRTGQTDPNALASWDINPGGGGGAPGSFINPGDRFIIQTGHTMTTTATWTIGSGTTILQLENGATLQGDHLIQFTGTFQIDNGGTYIHNNNGSVAQTPGGSSIFSGNELFGVSSNFEIRNWQDYLIGLPNTAPGLTWGNLIINMQVDLGGAWNWDISAGTPLTINGNLDIRSTYSGGIPRELRFTGIGTQIINVGGSFLLSGNSIVNLKQNALGNATGNVTMQVDGNVSLANNSQLNLGNPVSGATVGVFDLRFKGNFSASAATAINCTVSAPYLVANGTTPQTFTCPALLNCNFRVAPGAIVNQSGSIANGGGKVFAILGTYNDNGFTKTLSGALEVAGGIFNSTGSLAMGGNRCRSCTGDGTYPGFSALWCTGTGSKGRINFTSNAVTFDQNSSSLLVIGSGSSPGDIYLANNATVGFIVGSGGTGSVTLGSNSILSIADNSNINGNANYTAAGGTLRIGSADGITATGNTMNGNIRVSGTKAYNSSGTNSFEYFGTSQQVTGSGFPTTLTGTLKINNTAGLGAVPEVILSQPAQINFPGSLDLTAGKLSTSGSGNLLTIADNATSNAGNISSYVTGPLRKIGDEDFIFPIGKGVYFSPIGLYANGNTVSTTDNFTAEYITNNPQLAYPGVLGAGIDHMSSLEYWNVLADGGSHIKRVQLTVTTFSYATQLTSLVATRWDGSVWQNEGQSANSGGISTGTITSNNVNITTIINPFTLASTSAFPENPLPITLISFDATQLTSSRSSLAWELAACCSPTAKFEVQRAGSNKYFTTIGTIGGSGTNRFYSYTDNALQRGINYYRLKMTDEVGTITYSRTVAVMNGVNGLFLTSLIPTVIMNTATFTVTSSVAQKMDIMIVDMLGRVVQQQNYKVAAGDTNIQFSAERLGAGVYHLFGISAEGKTNWLRFLRQ